MQNPVYSREMKVSSRSIRLPLIIVLFNGILSMVTLLNMYSAVAQVEDVYKRQDERRQGGWYGYQKSYQYGQPQIGFQGTCHGNGAGSGGNQTVGCI